MNFKSKIVGAVNVIIEPGDRTAYQFVLFRNSDKDYVTIVGFKNFEAYDYHIDQVSDFFQRNPQMSSYEDWKDHVEQDFFFQYVLSHSRCDRHHALAALCCIKQYFLEEEQNG